MSKSMSRRRRREDNFFLAPKGRNYTAQGEALGGRPRPRRALKGRNRALSRPFGAIASLRSESQGFALGCVIAPLRG